MGVWKMDMDPGVVFGIDSRKQIGDRLKDYGATKVLLIYDMVMGQLGYADELKKFTEEAGIEVVMYEAEVGEPTYAMVNRAADFAMEHKIDGIIGLGGGATMDTAKRIFGIK